MQVPSVSLGRQLPGPGLPWPWCAGEGRTAARQQTWLPFPMSWSSHLLLGSQMVGGAKIAPPLSWIFILLVHRKNLAKSNSWLKSYSKGKRAMFFVGYKELKMCRKFDIGLLCIFLYSKNVDWRYSLQLFLQYFLVSIFSVENTRGRMHCGMPLLWL